MKKPKGFMLIELLITISISLILLVAIYTLYQAEITNFQFNKKRMEAIDRLWLSIDKIKKEVREGKRFESPDGFPFSTIFPDISQPPDSLVFTTTDNKTVAFFTYETDGNLYRAISGSTTATLIAEDTSISATPFSGYAEVTLSTTWNYRGKARSESITTNISLRNWRGY